MSYETSVYASGVKAFQQGQYAEAIQHLQQFSQHCQERGDTNSKPYFQAQVGLIKCYQASHQHQSAQALCQELAQGDQPQLKTWAIKMLNQLKVQSGIPETSPPPLPPTSSSAAVADSSSEPEVPADPQTLLEEAFQANRRGQSPAVIDLLNDYLSHDIPETEHDFMRAQMLLIKSHIAMGDAEAAIAMCEALQNTQNTSLKSWVYKTLRSLKPDDYVAVPPTPSPSVQLGASSRFTLQEFIVLGGVTLLMLVLGQMALGEFFYQGIFGQILFLLFLIAGIGSGIKGGDKIWKTGLGLFLLTLIPFLGIRWSSFVAWGAGTAAARALVWAVESSNATKLTDPKPARMSMAVGLGCLLALVTSLSFGGAGESSVADVGSFTPLHQAAGSGDVVAVQQLLAEGSEVDVRDIQGRTPLFWAAGGCVFSILTETTQERQCQITPSHAEITQLLIARGADVNAVDQDDYETPLHWAAEAGSPETVKILLENGADPNPSSAWESPLELAEWRGNEAIIDLLKQQGAQ